MKKKTLTRSLQQDFLPGFSFKKEFISGGMPKKKKGIGLLKSHAKTKRPFSSKEAMHVVIKSSKAKGKYSFLCKAKQIETLIHTQATQCGVSLYKIANAGNHLHLLIRAYQRRLFLKFLKGLTSTLMRAITGAKKGIHSQIKDFFDARPFTRIVSFGRDFKGIKNYLELNTFEVSAKLSREISRGVFAAIKFAQEKIKLQPVGFG